jgi:TRAP-type C4-dicarboxylate transport system substrate-binding protein
MKLLRNQMMRSVAKGVCALALSAGAAATTATAAEKLVYATYFSDGYSASKTDLWFMAEVEKRSGGEIKFETYWNQSLMKGAELFPSLRSGAADIVNGAPSGYNVREYPLANILLPFTSSKADAVALAWNKLYAQNADFRGEFESKGARILYAGPWAENSVWSRRQIVKVEDFKGLKIRAVPPISDAYASLGSTPVALTWPDGLEGLQRGVVDAMTGPFDSTVLGGAHEVGKFGSDAGSLGVYALAVVGMSIDRYNKLSEKHRKIIDEVSAEALPVGIRNNDESVARVVDKLCGMKDKLTISIFSPEQLENVRKIAVPPLQDAWLKRVKNETKADGKAMLDQFLGYVRDFEKNSTYVPGFERYLKKCG